MYALRLILIAVVLACLATSGRAAAEETEARQHYARGNAYFDQADYVAALREFESAYARARFPVILFNIAQCHAALGQPVKAAAAVEQLLDAPGNLSPSRIQTMRETLATQKLLIGRLTVTCNVDGAVVSVDGEPVGDAPLSAAVLVPSKRIVVAASAAGFVPTYRAIDVAGGHSVTMAIELERASLIPAQVTVQSDVPATEIWVDGRLVGVTPMLASVGVSANVRHHFEARRDGYRPRGEFLELGEAGTARLDLSPKVDRSAMVAAGGKLKLVTALEGVSVSVDGKRLVFGKAARPLPVGLHSVLVERTGYEPIQRDVVIEAHKTLSVGIDLPPTSETRAAWIATATLRRNVGWGLGIGGLVVGGVGAGLFAWSQSEASAAEMAIDDFECDFANQREACEAQSAELGREHDEFGNIATFGAVALTAGIVSSLTGAVLILATDDPDSFAVKSFDLAVTPGGTMIRVGGRF